MSCQFAYYSYISLFSYQLVLLYLEIKFLVSLVFVADIQLFLLVIHLSCSYTSLFLIDLFTFYHLYIYIY